jgi:serine/threonine protein kinase
MLLTTVCVVRVPALPQVLLKSSNADIRGFSAKVSDFGLSRVEDDDTCATFPFNSCGTAAYVAPEALINTKKVRAASLGLDSLRQRVLGGCGEWGRRQCACRS